MVQQKHIAFGCNVGESNNYEKRKEDIGTIFNLILKKAPCALCLDTRAHTSWLIACNSF